MFNRCKLNALHNSIFVQDTVFISTLCSILSLIKFDIRCLSMRISSPRFSYKSNRACKLCDCADDSIGPERIPKQIFYKSKLMLNSILFQKEYFTQYTVVQFNQLFIEMWLIVLRFTSPFFLERQTNKWYIMALHKLT